MLSKEQAIHVINYFWYHGKAVAQRKADPCKKAVARAWQLAAVQLAEEADLLDHIKRLSETDDYDDLIRLFRSARVKPDSISTALTLPTEASDIKKETDSDDNQDGGNNE